MLYRLKSRRGETLIETLVSLVIAAIATLMFSSMIASTVRLATEGEGWNSNVNNINEFLEKRESGGKRGHVTIKRDDLEWELEKEVYLYAAQYGGEDVISYEPYTP